MGNILGIDAGTTACKASVFDENGNVLFRASREYSLESWNLTIDPEIVWQSCCEVIRKCTAAYSDIAAVCTTSFGESVILVDDQRKPLLNSFLYSEKSMQGYLQEFLQKISAERIFSLTGYEADTMYTVMHLIRYREEQPDCFKRTAAFLYFSGFLEMRLGAPFYAEVTQAARSLAFHPDNKEWCGEIFNAAGIPEAIAPEIVEAGTVLGRADPDVAAALGFSTRPLLIAGGHDQPCVALGSGVFRPGDAAYGLGTVECLSVVLNGIEDRGLMRKYGYNYSPHVVPGQFLTYGVLFSGGNVIKEIRNRLFSVGQENNTDDLYREMFSGLSEIQTNVLCIPHFFGSGNPGMNLAAGGMIWNLRADTRPKEILAAVLLGLGFDLRRILETMEEAGIAVNRIYGSGGGTLNNFAMQIRSNAIDRSVRVLTDSQAGIRGTFLIAAKACGFIHSYEEIKNSYTEIWPDEKERDEISRRYLLYRTLTELCAETV